MLQAGFRAPVRVGQKANRSVKLSNQKESLTLELVTVLHVRFPVARLTLDVECQTCWASYGRQSGHSNLARFVASAIQV